MVFFVYVLLCLIWSSTWLGIKYVIDDVTPVTAAAARFVLAALIYLGIHLFRRINFPSDRRTCLAIMGMGVAQISISYTTTYWAEVHISSGMTAVLFATFPLVVAALSARLVSGESWTKRKAIGLACGLAGVGVVFHDQLSLDSEMAAYAVAAVVFGAGCCGVSIVYIKRWFNHHDTVALTGLQMFGAAISLTVMAFVFERPLAVHWTVPAILSTVYLAIFGSAIAFFGYYWLLKRIEGTAVAAITFVTPVLALVLGWVFRDEGVSWSLLIGAAFVLFGVRFVVTSKSTRATDGHARPIRRAA